MRYVAALLVLLSALVAVVAGSAALWAAQEGALNQRSYRADPELVIFAASSLTDAMNDMADAFRAERPGLRVVTNYAGSSSLATQLLDGAEADLFASANLIQMTHVATSGLVAGDPQPFATNQLVIVTPLDNPAAIRSLPDLANPGVRLVMANPGVPVRDYADALLAALEAEAGPGAGLADDVYANLVSEEANVRHVAAKVALGEADAGIVYASDVTAEIIDTVQQIPVPHTLQVQATYPVAVLANAQEPELAAAFLEFVLSEAGQAILQRWGFGAKPQ